MRSFTDIEPLTDAELDHLGDFLGSCKSGKAMNVEELDGFFAALIAGPETVMPSEYNRELFGGVTPEFSNLEETKEILGLLMRTGTPSPGRCLRVRSTFFYRTMTVWHTATTGQEASCAACICVTTAGRNLWTTRSMADVLCR